MIQSFRHRGLKQLFEKDNPKGLRANQVDKIARILARLDEATEVVSMNLPGFKLHPLKGDLGDSGLLAFQATGALSFGLKEVTLTRSIWSTITRTYASWLC